MVSNETNCKPRRAVTVDRPPAQLPPCEGGGGEDRPNRPSARSRPGAHERPYAASAPEPGTGDGRAAAVATGDAAPAQTGPERASARTAPASTSAPATDAAGEPEVLELERFLPYRLSVLSNTVSQAIADSYQRRFGLAITEWRVMAVLGRFDGLSAREVAARTAMDKVAVSRAVARLIDAGHVRRLVADHDKRQSVLRLSARGWKVYAQIAPLALDHERRLLAHLDADEQEWLGRILDKLWSAELEEIAR